MNEYLKNVLPFALGLGPGIAFHGVKNAMFNPAKQPMQELQGLDQMGKGYREPFISQGQRANEVAQPIFEQQAKDPKAFLDELLKGYEPSEGYKKQSDIMSEYARNTARAGGYAGGEADVRNRMDLINSLLSMDKNQYLQDVHGIQGQGLSGLQGITGQGFEAAGGLSDFLANNAGNRASLQYQGNAQQQKTKQDFINSMMTLFASMAGGGGMGNFGGQQGAGGQSQGFTNLRNINTRPMSNYGSQRGY